nr:uncharacterized protein LOC129445831 isoform X1 [Misgurnus anguillicaudatus]XP_055062799.1 uncharacterized protein LOC129445831 isoform X1 [Misgurnus anguillicaudatus]
MERREQEEIEVSTSHQLKGTPALKNFTIPRKKRTCGEVLLERCPEESRDYSLIHSKVRDSRLDTRNDLTNTCVWKDVHLVHNDRLLQKFSEKRAEMRTKGRHGREMEERFCFLVTSEQVTEQIYQDGLRVGSSVQHTLGKASHGVYLFRHVDVAMKATTNTISATNLLIFKVLYGKVKKIAPSLTWKKSQDPTVGFDCHMSKDVVSPQDTLYQQMLGSSVFLFDFNENQELSERPRQVLPYAVVSFVPDSSAILTPPPNVPFSPTTHADRFRACTVAQRRGKGDTATIIFKHFGTTQIPGVEYPFQNVQNIQAPNPRHHRIPIGQDSMLNHTTVSQNQKNAPGAWESSDKCDTTPSPSDKVSTIVYSSRSVRDPRLSRRETNQKSNCSEAETASSVLRSYMRNSAEDPQDKEANPEFKMAGTESGPEEPSKTDAQKNEDCSLQAPLNKCVQQKAETLPSIKLFKMKFQKYAEYFKLNEEERHKKIWSLENMSPEQKQALIDRVQFYEVYYQRYKKGLLSQKVCETEKSFSSSLGESAGKHIMQSKDNTYKQNQSDVSQTINAPNLSETCVRNTDNTYINDSKHQHNPENCAVMLPENKQDLLPKTRQDCVDHLKGCLVPSPQKLSKQFFEIGSLNHKDDNADLQIVQGNLKQPISLSCPFREGKTNPNIESHTGTDKEFENKSGPDINSVERHSHEISIMCPGNTTAMDIASFVEVSSCGMSENSNPNPAIAERQEQNEKNDSNFKDRDSLSRFTFSEDSEISTDCNMATLEENNSTLMELYERLQLDQLLPKQNCEQSLPRRAYLSPRVMGESVDTSFQQKNENTDYSKNKRCWEDLHLIVTLKASKMPAHTVVRLALSERFSKLKSCQKRVTALVNGYKEMGTHNAELIKLLAKRYNTAKLHAKDRSLRRPCKKTCFFKQTTVLGLGRFLRTKYIKKKHLWKTKKHICTNMGSTHEPVESKITSDNSSHTSKTVYHENKDQEPDLNSDEQQLQVQVSQESNAITNQIQERCSPVTSVINNDLTPSLGFKIISETKKEETKPAEPVSSGSFYTDMKKPTEDVTLSVSPVMVNEEEHVIKITNSSAETTTSLITYDSNKANESTITEEGSLSQEVTSQTASDPLGTAEPNPAKMSEDDKVETSESLSIFSHQTNLLTPESNVMCNINDKVETELDVVSDNTVDNMETSDINTSLKYALNSQDRSTGEMTTKDNSQNIPNKNKPGLATNDTCTNSSALSTYTKITRTNSEVEELIKEEASDLQHSGQRAWKCTSNNVSDLIDDENTSSSGHCEMASEHTKSNDTNSPGLTISNTQHMSTAMINKNCNFFTPEQNQNCDVDSPETQLISKLRDYLTKFESTVKKQETVNEGLRDKPLVWITLDSTAHKQHLAEKSQYRTGKEAENEAQARPDVYVLVPAESKRGRRSSQTKRASRHKSKRARWSSCPSVSPDSTSALDTVKDTSPQPQLNNAMAASTDIFINNEHNAQIITQSNESTRQVISNEVPIDQDSADRDGKCDASKRRSLDTVEIIDDGNVSSSIAYSDFSVSDISKTLKMADQTKSLAELGSLQSKCKNMLQQFILRFERDQKVSFKQSFVSRNLIVEQYLDHPPGHVDLKYEAVNSYLELQMMMEVWQFVENKINFLRGQPTFRSLLWYDPSLYGELYKGEVGFQQQSSLFTSFQKILTQEGYSKLHEYYITVSSLHQQLLVDPDASYYMYMKSKRELLEAEAALRNPHDIKSFFLSVPMTAMLNFGDSLESLQNVHQVIMSFVETPSDQLPGTFDVGKAEHLSITCRYLQEKAFFIRSYKEILTKVSWFGLEHLLYDASKILIWQDIDYGLSNEVLQMYKSSNPQIIFGVTESGVTLVNKKEWPRLSTDGAETLTEKQTDAAQKHKPTQLSHLQSINSGKEVAYSMSRRRKSHPATKACNMNDKGANQPFQPTPKVPTGNPTPYQTHHQKDNLVNWGMMGKNVLDWNKPSTSHVHSEIKSHLLSKRRVTSSKSEPRTSLADIQRVQAVREQEWPSVSAPQTTLQQDSGVIRPRFESVKHQQTGTVLHCPVASKEQVNQFTLAMAQPFNLPNFPMNTNFVAPPPPLSVQTFSNSLTHVPVSNMFPAINYPYFLLNGQTYSTDSTAASHPYTRYNPNTI